MVRLTVWTFSAPYSAEAVVTRLQALTAHELIRLDDAALVAWPRGAHRPYLKILVELPRIWRLDAAFWGGLTGIIFPFEQREAEGGCGASLAALGLNGDVLTTIREMVVEGTSALLLVIEDEVVRRIITAFEGMGYTLVETTLSPDQQQWVRGAFSAQA